MRKNYLLAFLLLMLFVTNTLTAQEGGIENLRQTGKAFASVARNVSPSVVFIQVENTQETRSAHGFSSPHGTPFNDDLLRRFLRRQISRNAKPTAAATEAPLDGSGFRLRLLAR